MATGVRYRSEAVPAPSKMSAGLSGLILGLVAALVYEPAMRAVRSRS